MDAGRFDSLARSLTHSGSRRVLTQALVAMTLAGALELAGVAQVAAKKKKKPKLCPSCTKRKQGKCRGTLPDGTGCADGTCQNGTCIAAAAPPPPPLGPNPSCQGPAGIAMINNRRYAQIFTAERTGSLTSAQCDVTGLVGGEDFVLEIRAVDEDGLPAPDALATTTISDVPATPLPAPFTLNGAFAPGAAIVSGQRYALVVTIAPDQSFTLLARTQDPCAGRLFRDQLANNVFVPVKARDMIYSASITV